MRNLLLVTAVLSGIFSVILLGSEPPGPFASWSPVVGWSAMAYAAAALALLLLWQLVRHNFMQRDHTPELRTVASREFGDRYR